MTRRELREGQGSMQALVDQPIYIQAGLLVSSLVRGRQSFGRYLLCSPRFYRVLTVQPDVLLLNCTYCIRQTNTTCLRKYTVMLPSSVTEFFYLWSLCSGCNAPVMLNNYINTPNEPVYQTLEQSSVEDYPLYKADRKLLIAQQMRPVTESSFHRVYSKSLD